MPDRPYCCTKFFGTIQYKGPGIFIAAGAGITPFIAIFRDLYEKKALGNNTLILSNKTSNDIIDGPELFQMLGARFLNVFTREGVIGFMERRIDRNYLVETIRDFSRNFYVCGLKYLYPVFLHITVDFL